MATNNAININTDSSGKILLGNGIGSSPIFSTPTYPSASGTSRKIIVSDGTNNVYSTETYAVPGSSGNVLTSDGTNWTSAAPASGSTTNIIQFTSGFTNPADGINYYLTKGVTPWATTNTVQTRVYFSQSGTITKVYGALSVGVTGSAETTAINIRLNNTTNTSIANVAFNAATATFSNTGLSIAVSAGDYIQFYLSSQSYSSNPFVVNFNFSVLVT